MSGDYILGLWRRAVHVRKRAVIEITFANGVVLKGTIEKE